MLLSLISQQAFDGLAHKEAGRNFAIPVKQ